MINTTVLDAARVMLTVLESIQAGNPAHIAAHMCPGWDIDRCRKAVQHAHAEVDPGTVDLTTIPHRTIDAMCGLQLLSCAADHTELYQRYNDETTLGRVRADLHRELATGRLRASHLPDLQLSALSGPDHSAAAPTAEL